MTELPKAEAVKKRRFSVVWLVPVLALVITGWLLYNGYVNKGKVIRVQFETGAGLLAGQTPLKYKGIDVGKVIDFEVAGNLDRVNVVIRLEKEAGDIARKGMKFWVVKPRLGIDQVTGLETILSGSYIEVKPPTYNISEIAKLRPQEYFLGLPEPPDDEAPEDAIKLTLIAEDDQLLFKGMGVYFNGIDAGKVTSIDYNDRRKNYTVKAYIERDYTKYINHQTRFWNTSGVDFKFDSAGVQLSSPPLMSLLNGGISFSSDMIVKIPDPLNEYNIYKTREETMLSNNCITVFMDETYGASAGRTPVLYKGLKIGMVTELELDEDKNYVLATVKLVRSHQELARTGSRFVLRRAKISTGGVENLSSILTGVYFELIAGDGESEFEYTLLADDIPEFPDGGVAITFTSDERGSVGVGSGIYFRGVQIGEVLGFKLSKKGVVFDGAIFREYSHLASRGLYLWSSSAVEVSFDEKLNVKAAPVSHIISGGVNAGFFDEKRGAPLRGRSLKLYKDEDSAKEAYIASRGIKKIFLVTDDATSLSKGAPVIYRGIQVGELGNRFLSRESGMIRISAMIKPEYKYLLSEPVYFWKQGGVSVSLNDNELKVKTPTVSALISGGVEFDTDRVVPEGMDRKIFDDREEALKAFKLALAEKKLRLYSRGYTLPPVGAEIIYKGVKAGEVYENGYNSEREQAYADVLLYDKFASTVTDATRFWKGSTLTVKATGDGIDVKSESMSTFLKGALHYDSFKTTKGKDVIYNDRVSAERPDHSEALLILKSANNLKEYAPVLHKKEKIGYVESVEKSGDVYKAGLVIYRGNEDLLREGSVFWLEDVELSMDGLKNADSVLYGAKVAMVPGDGEELREFVASDRAVSPFHGLSGLRLTLTADSRNSLEVGSPVYYRQVATGAVEWVRLSDGGDSVEVGVFIDEKYQKLVKDNSEFSIATGIRAKFGFFSGFRMETESVKAVLKGGISFKNPDEEGNPAKDGDSFTLYNE